MEPEDVVERLRLRKAQLAASQDEYQLRRNELFEPIRKFFQELHDRGVEVRALGGHGLEVIPAPVLSNGFYYFCAEESLSTSCIRHCCTVSVDASQYSRQPYELEIKTSASVVYSQVEKSSFATPEELIDKMLYLLVRLCPNI